jgi:hypothetical protein
LRNPIINKARNVAREFIIVHREKLYFIDANNVILIYRAHNQIIAQTARVYDWDHIKGNSAMRANIACLAIPSISCMLDNDAFTACARMSFNRAYHV